MVVLPSSVQPASFDRPANVGTIHISRSAANRRSSNFNTAGAQPSSASQANFGLTASSSRQPPDHVRPETASNQQPPWNNRPPHQQLPRQHPSSSTHFVIFPLYQPLCKLACHPTHQPMCWPTGQPTCPLTCQPTCLSVCSPRCLSPSPPTCSPLSAWMHLHRGSVSETGSATGNDE